MRKWREDCWARIFSWFRELMQSMREGSTEEEEMKQQQRKKVMNNMTKKKPKQKQE